MSVKRDHNDLEMDRATIKYWVMDTRFKPALKGKKMNIVSMCGTDPFMGQRAGESHYGDELRESDERKAERIVAEELKKLRWQETELEKRRKGDSRKVVIAKKLRKH